MNQLYDLYKRWYELYAGDYIDSIHDEIWLQFNHMDQGAIAFMHYDYDEAPFYLIHWRTLHHGLWLLRYCVEHGMGAWIKVQFSERVSHTYTVPEAYNAVVNMLGKQLDEGKALRSFLAFPINEDVLKSYLGRDFKITMVEKE